MDFFCVTEQCNLEKKSSHSESGAQIKVSTEPPPEGANVSMKADIVQQEEQQEDAEMEDEPVPKPVITEKESKRRRSSSDVQESPGKKTLKRSKQ